MKASPPDESFEPVNPSQRIAALDAIRGFALFGVLLVNMFNFGAYLPVWDGMADRVCNAIVHALFETKSLRLFALLFGLGLALQMKRGPGGSLNGYGFWLRRLGVLFAIGAVHALFYDGDILMEYALLGLLLLPVRRLNARGLLCLSLALMAVFPVGTLLRGILMAAGRLQEPTFVVIPDVREGHPYLGSVLDVFRSNLSAIPPRLWEDWYGPESSVAVFAMILLGFSMGNSGRLHEWLSNRALLRIVLIAGGLIGGFSAAAEAVLSMRFGYTPFEPGIAPIGVQFAGDILFAIGSTALALAYGAAIAMLVTSGCVPLSMRVLQALGRMALTVYLSGTLMFTLLFYGYGFGQLFLLGPVGTTAFAVLFFVIQAAFCACWLRWFRFGPFEWLWRCLAYFRIQPMRRAESS